MTSKARGQDPSGSFRARHRAVPHTADVGFRATAPRLEGLFEEAAAAVADLLADRPADAVPTLTRTVHLSAADLPGLAYGWLNELIAVAEIEHAAIVGATVRRVVEQPAEAAGTPPGPGSSWRLDARVGLRPYAAGGVRARRPVKSATYHALSVERGRRGWTMHAILDA